MADIIIILIVTILLGLALKGSIKHFKGEGPCCGGGSGSNKKAKTKFLDGPVIGRKTLKISGMHCEHCANTVTNALNGLNCAGRRLGFIMRDVAEKFGMDSHGSGSGGGSNALNSFMSLM